MTNSGSTVVAGPWAGGMPDFEHPPVNEVALSVQFNPIVGLDPYFGVYWATNRKSFDRVQIRPPLLAVTEDFGNSLARPIGVGFKLMSEPIARYWLLRAGDTELGQL